MFKRWIILNPSTSSYPLYYTCTAHCHRFDCVHCTQFSFTSSPPSRFNVWMTNEWMNEQCVYALWNRVRLTRCVPTVRWEKRERNNKTVCLTKRNGRCRVEGRIVGTKEGWEGGREGRKQNKGMHRTERGNHDDLWLDEEQLENRF